MTPSPPPTPMYHFVDIPYINSPILFVAIGFLALATLIFLVKWVRRILEG